MLRRCLHNVMGLAALLALACGERPTQIIVVVDSEFVVPGEVDRLEFMVIREADGVTMAETAADLAGPGAAQLPVTFSLQEGDGDPGPLSIRVLARHLSQPVATRKLNGVRFVPGEIMMLRMDILRSCQVSATCPTAGPLVPWIGTPEAWRADGDAGPGAAPVTLDAGAMATDGASDAAGPLVDGGTPEVGPMCVHDCDQSCGMGEQCAVACPQGGDCSLACTDEGTRCDLQSSGAQTTSLTCKKRARCSVAVDSKAKEARTICEDDAWCDTVCESPICQLDCRSAQCRLRASGAATTARVTCSKGADCSLDFAAGEDVDVVCNGSTCSVMCRGSARCDVKCIGGAICLLSCAASASCDLTNCPPPLRRDCGGGVFACGRECP